MSDITFSSQEKEAMVAKLQRYFEDELDQEIGQFDAEFLLDFIGKEMGAYFYNRGVHDARAIVAAKVESIDDEIYSIEKDVF